MRQNLKKFALLGLGTIGGTGANFFIQVYLAKVLTVVNFGIYTSIINLINLVTPIIAFGVTSFMLKVYAEEFEDARLWFKSIIKFLFLSSLVVLFFLQIWAYMSFREVYWVFIVILFFFHALSLSLNSFTILKLQLENNFYLLSIWQFLPNILRLILLLGIIFVYNKDFHFIGLAYFLTSVVVLSFSIKSIINLKKGDIELYQNTNTNTNTNTRGFFELIKLSFPFGMAGIFYLIYYQIDVFLIALFLDYEKVAVYGVGLIFLTSSLLLPNLYYQKICMPKLHYWNANNRKFLLIFCNKNIYLNFIIGVSLVLMVGGGLGFILKYIFNSKYDSSIYLYYLMISVIPIRLMAMHFGSIMSTGGLVGDKMRIMGWAAVFNIVFNLILIPLIGIFGAAISTILTEVFLLVLFQKKVKEFLRG